MPKETAEMRVAVAVLILLSLGCTSQRAERCFMDAEASAAKYVPGTNRFDDITNPQFNAAQENYQRAIRLAPRNAKFHHRFGLLLRRSGQGAKGKAEIQVAVSLDPLYTDAKVDLERIERGERAEAQRQHEETQEAQEAQRRRDNEEFVSRMGEEQRRTDRERELRREWDGWRTRR